MAHIHTGAGEHDLTVSAYIVREDTTEPSIMFHRHKILGKYLQFGGHVELHEDPWEAISHEILEESGYEMQQLKLLQPELRLGKVSNATLHPVPVSYLTHTFEGLDHRHIDTAFAFTASEVPANNTSDGESDEIKLFAAEELRSLPANEVPENVREIGLFVLERIYSNWIEIDL